MRSLWSYLRERVTRHPHLTDITYEDYVASRRSDRIFIFGSGASLNDITPEQWTHIAEHNTFGFSLFVYQEFVRTDYHLLRELYIGKEFDRDFWLPYSQEFVDYLDSNPHFDDTILLVQSGWRSMTVNRIIALGLLKKSRKLLRFKTKVRDANALPSFNFEDGIVHGAGTLTDAVNLAALGGWKHLILTGVDLYDGRYFWEAAHANAEDFGRDPNQVHNTVNNGIIDSMARWRDALAEQGIKLWVYNPRSLLTRVLPVYDPANPIFRDGDG
jgi:hypothetical protein